MKRKSKPPKAGRGLLKTLGSTPISLPFFDISTEGHILNTHAVLYFSRRGRRVTQSFDCADGSGFSRNAVRMEHTSEAKYVSAQSVLARLCPA